MEKKDDDKIHGVAFFPSKNSKMDGIEPHYQIMPPEPPHLMN